MKSLDLSKPNGPIEISAYTAHLIEERLRRTPQAASIIKMEKPKKKAR